MTKEERAALLYREKRCMLEINIHLFRLEMAFADFNKKENINSKTCLPPPKEWLLITTKEITKVKAKRLEYEFLLHHLNYIHEVTVMLDKTYDTYLNVTQQDEIEPMDL